MSDPRESPNWEQMTHQERIEKLLGAIIDELDSIDSRVINVESAIENLTEVVKYS